MNIKKVRVLHIIGNVCGGGVESVVMNYYMHINRNKIQFDFVINGYEKNDLESTIQQLGGKVFRVEKYSKNIIKYMIQIYFIIKKNNYKIVHTHMNSLSFFSLFPAWLAGAKIRVIHNHSTAVKNEGIRSIIKTILRPIAPIFANKYIACSKLAAQWMYGSYWKEKNVYILNNAIDLQRFAYSSIIRDKLRNSLKIPSDSLVFGHVGRFMFQKNHEFLIDLFASIYKLNNKAILLLVGDGKLKPNIEEKVKLLKLEQNVLFLGIRKDVFALYNVMDMFILPSWYEGLPVVAVEAQANGLPCMLSDKVTNEAKLLKGTDFYSLDLLPKEWGDIAMKKISKRENDATSILRKEGFDINKTVAWLEKFYLNSI